jgi:hypothetical protein
MTILRAEPVWIERLRAGSSRVPGTCPFCGVMSPFPHLSGCPRATKKAAFDDGLALAAQASGVDVLRLRVPLDQAALGCTGLLVGPADLIERTSDVLALLGPVWQAHFERAIVPLPRTLTLRVRPTSPGRDTRTGFEGSWGHALLLGPDAMIELSIGPTLTAARLHHMAAHELAHLFVAQASAGERVSGGSLPGEYAAERVGWEIALAAGLRPDKSVSIEAYRKIHRAWLRPLARIALGARQGRTRDLRWLDAAAGQIVHAEAYRRGQAGAGVVAFDDPPIPAALEAALDEFFGPIRAWALPALANGQRWQAFMAAMGPQMSSHDGHIGSRSLAALARDNQGEFLAYARTLPRIVAEV